MDPLLIVLAIGCALASVTYAARGLHARSRTVERHQHALGTLGDITQRPDGPQGWSEEPTDHQAHVRLIGPSGRISPGNGVALPPPRALSSPGSVNPSPFRRPSRTGPSIAAMDAVATSANLGRSPGARVLRSGSARPTVRSLPGHEPAEATLPGLPPQPDLFAESGLMDSGLADSALAEPGLSGEPTRPVPVVQPQVFHFDDRSPARKGSARAGGGSRGLDKLRLASRHFGRRPSITGVVLAAAAVAVAIAAVGIALDLRSAPSQTRPQLQTAAQQTPVTSLPAPTRKASPPTTTPVPTTPVPTTPPVTVASYPAVLVSSSGGTATYQLSSPSASIVVRAKGRCWLEVRANSPLGQIVYEGILEAGQQSSVTGPAWLRVGDPPEVAVRVDGQKMPVPGAGLAVPINLQFSLG
jgi:hypothetical protein